MANTNATVISVAPSPPSPAEYAAESEPTSSLYGNATSTRTNIGPSPKLDEYRNMIRHILTKISKRRRPPSALVQLVESCTSVEPNTTFDNEEVVDLLMQLRTALTLCEKSGLGPEILIQRDPRVSPGPSQGNSPIMATSPQTLAFETEHKVSSFENIVAMLDDLVLNDCRYSTANPRPSRPPYSMQSVLVDVATILVTLCDDTMLLSIIGTTMLPAFDSFPEGPLLGKLLGFFLDALLPRLSQCKAEQKTTSYTENRHKQAQHTTVAAAAAAGTGTATAAPTINIQSPDFDEDNTKIQRSSHLTIDTQLSPTSSPSSPQQHHHIQHTARDPVHALFTPLVFFMIEYLDPYLEAAHLSEPLTFTLPHQSHSIHNFHKALCLMINQKPDFYLDLLRVISHGAPDVRFRACQILFHYYNISTGHVVVAEDLPEFGSKTEIETLAKAMEQQTFEQDQQHQNDPTFLESMMGNNNSNNNNNTVYNGINRKYRSGLLNPVVGASSPAPRSDESLDGDDNSTNSRESHIWFPHMFAENSRNQAEELTLQASQRLSTGIQAFSTVVHDDMNGAYCKECYKIIKGYGLRCYQCKCSLHYGCLSNSEQDIMLYVKEGGIQKVVSPQFCRIPPQPRFCCDTSVAASSSSPTIIHLLGHQFILVNLYTLMLCASCCLPLWGISYQGYRCSTCNRFVHPDCLAKAEQEGGFKHAASTIQGCHPYQPLLESHTKISETALCDGLRGFYGDLFPSSESDMVTKSFEEVGVMLNILLIQDNILQCGIASGCLLISQESDDPLLVPQNCEDVDMTRVSNASPALRNALRLCMKYIKTGSCPTSRFLGSFYSNRQHIVEECVLSKEEYLAHICAMMKSGIASTKLGEKHTSLTSDYLQVEQWDDHPHGDDAWDATPQEVIDRDAMLEWLMDNVRIKSRRAAEILLQHMRNLGLFERQDGTHMLFTLAGDKPVPCIFPVPYVIDCMPTVETLVDAIEACLDDIDITINECGMLLLVRRCWPDPFISRYTCERLILAILSWVFQEDEKLSALHAEYTGDHGAGHKLHPLPGVKNSRWTQAAQAALVSRMKGADKNNRQSITFAMGMSSGAGNVYVTTRGALRDRYLVRWMAMMHEMDPKGYASMLFDTIERIVEGKREECVPWIDSQDEQKATTQRFEEFVGYILKLKASGLAFSALDEVLQRWLDKSYDESEQQGLLRKKEPADIRNLAKLCSSKVTVSKSPAAAGKSAATAAAGDPSHAFDVITALFAAGDTGSVERGMRWLALVMHAGTGIPPASVAKIARHLVLARASITTTAKFVELLWFQSVNILNVSTSRAVIIDAVGYLNEIALDSLHAKENDQDLSMERLASAQKFIKYSAALTCFAYNCPLGNIAELDIVPYFGDHVAQLTHNKRASTHVDNTLPMQVDENTPVIRCMLLYLRFDQLNIRADVLKMFYALIHWGFGISNKSDLISQATPALTSA
ncbi:hypothetical protein BDB00DRAFT_448176 [Zychaea mexicana]|uniref:uncharacterized protein n=1 Tax=Zychaea mexicana TaxID=64656 RepID=UPI0022FEEF7B|nr:uncharacterized protein BDB00DRAFT_448176 [Zychaea mexicana]KAI9498425.1 hypothetical protein BDB00DRAFT_448176 [Zychaea mexicana]